MILIEEKRYIVLQFIYAGDTYYGLYIKRLRPSNIRWFNKSFWANDYKQVTYMNARGVGVATKEELAFLLFKQWKNEKLRNRKPYKYYYLLTQK